MESIKAGLLSYQSYCDNMKNQIQEYQKIMNQHYELSFEEIPILQIPNHNLLKFYEKKEECEKLQLKYSRECKFSFRSDSSSK